MLKHTVFRGIDVPKSAPRLGVGDVVGELHGSAQDLVVVWRTVDGIEWNRSQDAWQYLVGGRWVVDNVGQISTRYLLTINQVEDRVKSLRQRTMDRAAVLLAECGELGKELNKAVDSDIGVWALAELNKSG